MLTCHMATVRPRSICGWLTHSFAQETSKRRLPRVAVKGVGGLLEFDAIEKALEIAGYRVSGHDEGGIERMDVFARDRAFGVTLYPSKLIIYGRHTSAHPLIATAERTWREVRKVPHSEFVRFGVATLVHDVGTSPQSHIGRSEK